jgi:ureidoglycolate lyase
MTRTLTVLPLTAERFAPFGDVIETSVEDKQAMNSSKFERYSDLAQINVGADAGGRPSISIAVCRTATALPYRVDMLERHPLGSQAFIPLTRFPFVVVVAPAAEEVEVDEITAFVTNGRQGINYHQGVWHMPMISMQRGQEFLIIDRAMEDEKGEEGDNCDEHYLSDPILIDS